MRVLDGHFYRDISKATGLQWNDINEVATSRHTQVGKFDGQNNSHGGFCSRAHPPKGLVFPNQELEQQIGRLQVRVSWQKWWTWAQTRAS